MEESIVVTHRLAACLVAAWAGVAPFAEARVDLHNANYSDSWLDFCIGGCKQESLNRTYNSRTNFSGLFGYGWCSDIETTIRNVEGALLLTNCGAGKKVTLKRRNGVKLDMGGQITTILNTIRAINPVAVASPEQVRGLQEELERDSYFREEFLNQIGISIPVFPGVYESDDGSASAVVRDDGVSVKVEATQFDFDREWNLVVLTHPSGAVWNVTRDSREITIRTSDERWTLVLGPQGTVSRALGPRGVAATYRYKQVQFDGAWRGWENVLVGVTNEWTNSYGFRYDRLANLVRVDYPNNTSKRLTYLAEKDWVTSFTDHKDCMESYEYLSGDFVELEPQVPIRSWSMLKHIARDRGVDVQVYASSMVRKCLGKPPVTSHEVFLSSRGTLAATASNVNGQEAFAKFDEQGRPVAVRRDPFFSFEITYAYPKARSSVKVTSNGLVAGRVTGAQWNCQSPTRIDGVLLESGQVDTSSLFSATVSFVDAGNGGGRFARVGTCVPAKLDWQAPGARGSVSFIWTAEDTGRVQMDEKLAVTIRALAVPIDGAEAQGACDACTSRFLVDVEARAADPKARSWLERCADLVQPTSATSPGVRWKPGACTLDERVALGALMLYEGVASPVSWAIVP